MGTESEPANTHTHTPMCARAHTHTSPCRHTEGKGKGGGREGEEGGGRECVGTQQPFSVPV